MYIHICLALTHLDGRHAALDRLRERLEALHEAGRRLLGIERMRGEPAARPWTEAPERWLVIHAYCTPGLTHPPPRR